MKNKICITCLVFTLIAVFDLTAAVIWTKGVLEEAKTFETPHRVQVAVILMGDFTDDYTALGPGTLQRLNHALELQEKMTIENFLCVGGSRPSDTVFGADLMGIFLVENGIAADRVYADGLSYDTKSNWSDALKLIRSNGWKDVGVISSPLHLHRMKNSIVGTEDDLNVSMFPFPYEASRPETTLTQLWKAIHHEWITYALYAMPDAVYDWVVGFLRPQKPMIRVSSGLLQNAAVGKGGV